MKIALVDAFPTLERSAEREFIARAVNVLNAMGHEARRTVISDELESFNPDLVICTHEFAPKLTSHFTAGVLWSPPVFYKSDSLRLDAIRSWDLTIPINKASRELARDLHYPHRHTTAVSDRLFFPSAPVIENVELPDAEKLRLVYVGVHWDGSRHSKFLHALTEHVDLHIYGPENAWKSFPKNYRGSIPFDGVSMFEVLNKHGAVLALHKNEHLAEDTPSMRAFEGAASKCLVITDEMPSLRAIFGDDFEYVQSLEDAQAAAKQVASILARRRANPAETTRKIESAHRKFSESACLEVLFAGLIADAEKRMEASRTPRNEPADPCVSVIVRCGGRPLEMIKRAVGSIERQTYGAISLIFVCYRAVDGLDAYVEELDRSGRFRSTQTVNVEPNGKRSTSLWAGLRSVATPFFAMLDDDDEWFEDHLAHVMEIFETDPTSDFVHSGGIRHEEEGTVSTIHWRFKIPNSQEIAFPETRDIAFIRPLDVGELMNWRNYVIPASFVARTSLLTPAVLDDPELEVVEDVYLFLLLIARGAKVRFNGRVSVVWNWRSKSVDNSMTAVDPQIWARSCERIARRLSHHRFPGEFIGQTVIGPGDSPRPVDAHQAWKYRHPKMRQRVHQLRDRLRAVRQRLNLS